MMRWANSSRIFSRPHPRPERNRVDMSEVSAANDLIVMTDSLSRALSGAPIGVGTENSAKCSAVRIAFESLLVTLSTSADEPHFGKLDIRPVAVSSGVSDQPVGFDEIIAGARNRARSALGSGAFAIAVGIEDGLVLLPNGLGGDSGESGESAFNVGCAWVCDGEREGSGFSSAFAYPPECLEPAIRNSEPIGELFDALWRRRRKSSDYAPSGRNEGNIGKLTAGRLVRSDYGSHAVVCALVRFLQRDLYD